MEELGLPMSFGKQQPAASGSSSLPPKPPPPARGEPGQRGPRGVVGGGKRRRGGGRGGGHNAHNTYSGYNAGSGANAQPVSTRGENPSAAHAGGHGDTDNADGELNPGVKRPPTSPDHARGRGRGRGGRHGGHGHGHGGGHGAGHGGNGGHGGKDDYTTRGYFQESFCEDPWRELVRSQLRFKKKLGLGRST